MHDDLSLYVSVCLSTYPSISISRIEMRGERERERERRGKQAQGHAYIFSIIQSS